MNLTRNDEKKYVEIEKNDFLGNSDFLVEMFYSPMGYLATRMS